MPDFAKMDVFFIITTLTVVIVGALVVVVLIRIIRIMGHVERIMRVASREADSLGDDFADLRRSIRNGRWWAGMKRFVRTIIRRI